MKSDSIILKKVEETENTKRAFQLSNGDVFQVKTNDIDYLLEYENTLLYEVVFIGYGKYLEPLYERTGKILTPKELNNLVKKSNY